MLGLRQEHPDLRESSARSLAHGADAGAGSWRMIVLSAPRTVPGAAAAPVGSDAYQAELASIKTAQASLTDAQRAEHRLLEPPAA